MTERGCTPSVALSEDLHRNCVIHSHSLSNLIEALIARSKQEGGGILRSLREYCNEVT